MQAVILAAGASTRTWPLTVNRPKPLLKVLNRTLLEHNLDQLTDLVDEAIIVVGFMKDRIIRQFGDRYGPLPLTFVDQREPLGTGHALLSAKSLLKDRFLALNGDDLFSRTDLEQLLEHRYAALAAEVDDLRNYGAHIVENDRLVAHVEKPKDMSHGRCNVGCYVFDRDVFDIELRKSPRGEFEITDYLAALAERTEVRSVLARGYWLPVSFAWKLLDCTEYLLARRKGDMIVRGADCADERATFRGFAVLGDRCSVGDSLIENSVIMDNARIGDGCVISNSIVGENVVIGNRFETRTEADGGEVRSRVKDHLVKTGRRKLGVIIGNGAVIEDNVVTLPGVKIWPGRRVAGGGSVTEDIGGWPQASGLGRKINGR